MAAMLHAAGIDITFFMKLFILFIYSVSHRYLFMADTIFEHLKYQLDQN
jgi:hypothetical protein